MTAIAFALAPNGAVVAVLRRAFPQVLAIYAFGSRVQGMARADSDLDLAVLVASKNLGCYDVVCSAH